MHCGAVAAAKANPRAKHRFSLVYPLKMPMPLAEFGFMLTILGVSTVPTILLSIGKLGNFPDDNRCQRFCYEDNPHPSPEVEFYL
jgi:hypothetical protein